jgi:NIPSNAP
MASTSGSKSSTSVWEGSREALSASRRKAPGGVRLAFFSRSEENAVIVELREYHVLTGRLDELVRLYETEGIGIQQEELGGLIGAFTTDVGAGSTYTHLWRYDSYAEREQRRSRLLARDDWRAFLAKIQPLIHTQQNRILVPVSFSPIQ